MLRDNHFWYVVLPENIRHLDFEEQHPDDATAIATLYCPTCNVGTQRVEINLEVESDFQPRCEHIALYIKTAEDNTLDYATCRRLREKQKNGEMKWIKSIAILVGIVLGIAAAYAAISILERYFK